MDTNVMSAFDVLAETMRDTGYAESTITRYRRLFAGLDRFTDGGGYTGEAGRRFVASFRRDGAPHDYAYRKAKERAVALMEGYLSAGRFDLAPRCAKAPKARPQEERLGASLSSFEADVAERGLAPGVVYNYTDMARLFLLFAEESGATEATSIAAAHVLGFVARMREVRSGTETIYIASFLRPYLRFLCRDDLVGALALTASPRKHLIVEVLSDEDEEAIARACCNRLVGARDAAVTLLALTTGLRAGDIINMRMGDICWRSMAISMIQHKTGNPVKLPLQPAVADAIGEYVLEERPDTGDDHLFLQSRAPYAPLGSSGSVYLITRKAMSVAGVDGGGTRLLRHNAATKMLRAGVSHPIISAVLGHADPDSTSKYMELDSEPMRSCVLPLPEEVRSWL